MERERVAFTVIMSLDPVPGAFHTKKDAEDYLTAMLLSSIPHYDPVVIPIEI